MTNLPATPIHPTFWQGYPADPFLAHLNLTSPSNTSHAGHSGEMWQAGVSTHVAWSPPLRTVTPDSVTLNPATAPACRSDSMFPGSRKAMLMRKPGPVKAHSFRKLNVPCRWE